MTFPKGAFTAIELGRMDFTEDLQRLEAMQGTEERRRIFYLLRDTEDELMPREIAKATGMAGATVRRLLAEMRKDGTAFRNSYGAYILNC